MEVSKWITLNRAFQIAKLGGYSITIVANKLNYPEAFEDLELIKSFYKGVEFTQSGGLCVELYKPGPFDYGVSYEALLKDIDSSFTEVELDVSDAMKTLIKTAHSRLNLSESKLEFIYDISKTIARLDKHKKVKIEHIAEAIHYIYKSEDMTPIVQDIISFTYDELHRLLDEAVHRAMLLRQDQLNGISSKSGNDLIEEILKEYK